MQNRLLFSFRFFFGLFLGSLLLFLAESAQAQADLSSPESVRLFVAEQICAGPAFTETEYAQCVEYLVRGDYKLNEAVEFQVLKSLLFVANSQLIPGKGVEVVPDIEETLRVFALVEGKTFSADVLTTCQLFHFRYDGLLLVRNDEDFLGCLSSYSEEGSP